MRCPLHLPDSYLGRQVRVGDVLRVFTVSGTGAGIASPAAPASAAAAAASGIATAASGVRCPLHLPDSRLGRQVRVGDVLRVCAVWEAGGSIASSAAPASAAATPISVTATAASGVRCPVHLPD